MGDTGTGVMTPLIDPREISDLQFVRLENAIRSYEDPPGCAGVLWRLSTYLPERLVEREPLASWLAAMLEDES